MEVSAEMVKRLRAKTGGGILACRKALLEAQGELGKAEEILRKKGLKVAAKKAGRKTSEGQIGAYIHPGGKVGVMVELQCETDFVARTESFQELLKELCLQVAAFSPRYITCEEIPPEIIEKEKEIYRAQMVDLGKPEHIIEKIIEGKLKKGFFTQTCLLEQPYIRDDSKTVKDLLISKIARLGENVSIKRFERYQLGE